MKRIKNIELRRAVDELGSLKAEIAKLTAREKTLKAIIALAAGPNGAIEGETFRAAVSTAERATVDMDAVRGKLSPQFLAAHTTYAESVSVRVSARLRDQEDGVFMLRRAS